MDKAISIFLLVASILLSLVGIGAFILLFGRDLNVFWVILAPIIIAVYQIPAVAVFYLRKRWKKRGHVFIEEKTESQENDFPQAPES